MKFKRIFAAALMLLVLCTAFTICTPDSQAYSYLGSCGENASYFHLADGTLYINGSGEMYDYSESNPAPWHEVAGSITGLNISSRITGIGDYAFADCNNLRTIVAVVRLPPLALMLFITALLSKPFHPVLFLSAAMPMRDAAASHQCLLM